MNLLPCLARHRAVHVATIAVALLAGRLAAQETPTGPVVELPKFVVTDSRELPPPESWRYGEIPGFEILSNATERTTKQLIRDFMMFKLALSVAFPVPDRSPVPTTIILCGKNANFAAFVPAGNSTIEGVRASVFVSNREQSAIVVDLAASTLNLISNDDTAAAAVAGVDPTRVEVEHHKQLYREYVHYLLGRNEPRPPAWLEEGIAQIVMAMKFEKTLIVFGEIETRQSARAGQITAANALASLGGDLPLDTDPAPIEDVDFNSALAEKALVPWPEFFAVRHDSPIALNPLGNNRWAKQAYAFVHMCLYGRGGRYQKPFAQFLARISKEPPSEAVFKDCFKLTYKGMSDELRGYINLTDYKRQEFEAKKGGGLGEPPPLELREATQAEIGRIKGEAMMLAGNKDGARTALVTPYIRGERDPRLLAAIGLNQHALGDDEKAHKFLTAAAAAKVTRAAAYLELARLRYNDALAKPAGGDGAFSGDQTFDVLDLLGIARTQPPPMPAVYELMAETWARSVMKPKREEIAVLIEGVKLFPTRLRLLYTTSAFCVEAGMNDVAVPLIDYGLKIAPDAKAKSPFEKLKASLPAAAKAPAK